MSLLFEDCAIISAAAVHVTFVTEIAPAPTIAEIFATGTSLGVKHVAVDMALKSRPSPIY
jgi:hypothetical protein